MADLTVKQITKLRVWLAAFSDSFTDEELEAYFDVAFDEDPDTAEAATMAYAFNALATQAIPLVNYRQGETSESLDRIFDRIDKLYQYWSQRAGHDTGLPKGSVKRLRQWHIAPSSEEYEADA